MSNENETRFNMSIMPKLDGEKNSKSIFRRCFPYRGTDSAVLPSWPVRIGLFLFGVLQNGLSGGLIFGWASIDQSILTVPEASGGAGMDLQETTTIFSWSTSISMVAALMLGVVLDYSGPRIASMVSCWSISSGCLIFALSDHFFGYAVGVILLGFGGPGIGNCIIHLANLFPGNENLAMSTLSGSIAFSFSVFAVFDSLWTEFEEISFRHLFGGFAISLFSLGVGAAVLYPDEPYERLLGDDLVDSDEDLFSESDEEVEPLTTKQFLLNQNSCEQGVPRESIQKSHYDHHEKHRQSGHAPPRVSLIVEQPFNSYLRDRQRMLKLTDSYMASRKSLAGGVGAISLKDQPFFEQLSSASYLRAFLVFFLSTFVTNFYVGSLSTEVNENMHILQIHMPLD